jgi:hypothetical protein
MSPSQLIPPADQAPPSIADLSPEARVRLWAQMVDEGDQIVFDGFLRRLGDESAARRAFWQWLDRRSAETTAAKVRMLNGCQPAERAHGG